MLDEREQPKELSYIMAEEQSVLIVSFVGPFIKANSAILEKCLQDILVKSCKAVILNLQEVKDMNQGGIPPFVKFQASIRKQPAILRLCHVPTIIGNILDEQGSLREEEVDPSLAAALKNCQVLLAKQEQGRTEKKKQ